jgi:hypothetical protein
MRPVNAQLRPSSAAAAQERALRGKVERVQYEASRDARKGRARVHGFAFGGRIAQMMQGRHRTELFLVKVGLCDDLHCHL